MLRHQSTFWMGEIIFEEKKHLKNDQKLWSTLGMSSLWIGGTNLIWSCLFPGIFGAVLCIKARENLNLVNDDVWPHVRGVWKFGKSPLWGQKLKLPKVYGVTYQNLISASTSIHFWTALNWGSSGNSESIAHTLRFFFRFSVL